MAALKQEEESISEIQNYLDTFNKEIEDPNQIPGSQLANKEAVVSNEVEAADAPEDGGTYFVDQSGQYYYQSNDVDGGDGTATLVAQDGGTMVSIPNNGTSADEGVVLAQGEGGYQTVTILPPESSSGEVSYVLIVQQPDGAEQAVISSEVLDGTEGEVIQEDEEAEDDENFDGDEDKDEDQNLAVYDFDEGEEGGSADGQDSEDEDIKPRMSKGGSKKVTQTVSQAHMCNYCNYTSPKRYLLSRHMKCHSEERPHKCSVCDRGFKTLASLQNHVNTHTGTKPHRCKHCHSSFTTSGELVRHVRYRHTHEKPHRCTECDYASVELSKLKRHMRCHTGERPYQCPHCTYASPDTFKLKRHLRIHTGEKPYECDICHARFTQSNSLKAHKLIHTGNKPIFQCELCPTTCGRKTDLRIHVQKLHTSEKPLKCKRCGKSFPDRYTFKLHSKTHEGEKCFKCDLCAYASISQRHLESHMLIHTDQKPYQCDQCDQCFRQKQLLRRHQNLYHNPDYVPPPPGEKRHECPECGKPFRHKGNLIRHLALHDPDAAQQELRAFRAARKQRIKDGQSLEGLTEGEETDMEDEDISLGLNSNEELVSVQGQDGQQYVVLEVIQLEGEGGDEDEATMMEVEGATEMDGSLMEGEGNTMTSLDDEIEDSMQATPRVRRSSQVAKAQDTSKDVANCFGFDDEEDDEEDDEDDK
uniref:C2H2-type domain-containing protein n=1 Tax=Daphnia galeata TaxID=27404 RepID=A0A8J2RKM1_9CRUS|nr:unnamed protein product [Daphnia galeata]